MQFKPWLNSAGQRFWKLLSLSSIPQEDLRGEFIELALQLRKRFQQKKHLSLAEGSRYFWLQWLKQQRKGAETSLWQERLLTFGLFALKWNLDELAFLTQKHPSKLRFEIAESLKREGLQSGLLAPPISRACSRNDLFLVDALLEQDWPNPLALFGPKDFQLHMSECSRCQNLWQCLENSVEYLKRVELSSLPQSVVDDLLEDIPDDEKLMPGQKEKFKWSSWPLYVRIPLQVVTVVTILFVVVRLPTVSFLVNQSLRFGTERVLPPMLEFKEGVSAWVSRNAAHWSESSVKTPDPVVVSLDPVAPQSTVVAENIQPRKIENAQSSKSDNAQVSSIEKIDVQKPIEKPVTSATPVVAEAESDRFFLRWGAFSVQLEQDSRAVVALLKKYKAETAGELELGAFYRGGRYYHFRIPVKNWQSFENEVLQLSLKSFSRKRVDSGRSEQPGMRRAVFLIRPDDLN